MSTALDQHLIPPIQWEAAQDTIPDMGDDHPNFTISPSCIPVHYLFRSTKRTLAFPESRHRRRLVACPGKAVLQKFRRRHHRSDIKQAYRMLHVVDQLPLPPTRRYQLVRSTNARTRSGYAIAWTAGTSPSLQLEAHDPTPTTVLSSLEGCERRKNKSTPVSQAVRLRPSCVMPDCEPPKVA